MSETPQIDTLRQKTRLQRIAMLWEQVWAAIQGPALVALAACALLWSGLLNVLPRPLPFVVLIALAGLFLFSLKSLLILKSPPAVAVLRKLESSNDLHHREASSLGDTFVPGSGAEELWTEHLRRKLAALRDLNLAWPKSLWRSFDPLALRLPIMMLALAGFFLGNGGLVANLQNAASLTAPPPEKAIVLDAWAKPPPYTGKAPLLLTSPAMVEKLKAQGEIVLPENSTFSLRLTNAAAPQLTFTSPGSDAAVKLADAKIAKTDEGFTAEVKLDRPVTVKVMDGTKELVSYPFTVVADEAPKIEFVGEPRPQGLGHLAIKWKASDDYGVKSVTSEISLSDTQEDGQGFANNGVFLYEAPVFKIAISKPNAKLVEETTTGDLAGHPWAGLFVEMTLTVQDAAGHKTTTAPQRFKLPEREFIRPLAQAFAEQRKKIILSPDAAPDASTMLGAMLRYPVDIKDSAGLILNLASVKSRLATASAPEDVVAVVNDLWPLILGIEDGKMKDVREELKNLAAQLKQALRDGAPNEKIDELMRRMREAMNKLADQLQKEGKKRQADGTMPKQRGKALSPEDLQKMLDAIEQLNKNGSKDAAEQMLSELDKLLQNLQPGEGSMADNGAPGAQEQMDALSGMMGKQRKLMDETQRMGQNGKDGEGEDLAGKQKGLKGDLGKLGEGLSPGEGGDSLGEAGKNMGQAEGALRGNNKDEALRQQGEVMKKLREAMGKLADKAGKQGQQGAGGRSGNANDDPLGRPRASHNPNTGPNRNLVPSELSMRRAREILEELRGRANAEGLDENTKAYIDRLLKGLY
jgi:uncharacterized protein (TIGR02302 family)